jgi:hypothetical protein
LIRGIAAPPWSIIVVHCGAASDGPGLLSTGRGSTAHSCILGATGDACRQLYLTS